MLFDSLRVLHAPKQKTADKCELVDLASFDDRAFYFESCLRTLLIYAGSHELKIPATATMIEVYEGANAYNFLLRVATGLESPLKGETEIFGQFKEAWASYRGQAAANAHINAHVNCLSSLIEKLFNDAKSIRSEYLQGIGGSSYGSLVRKMIAPTLRENILILGAGDLASQIAPLFVNWPISIWNRNKTKLNQLVTHLQKNHGGQITTVEDEALSSQIANHNHVIICIPADELRELAWIKARQEAASVSGKVVHLGAFTQALSHWQNLPDFHTLTTVLSLDRDQDEIRQAKIQKAGHACHEKANQRALSETLNLLNGWEDLSFG